MPNVVHRAERRARRPMHQHGEQHQIVLRARDDSRQILILFVEAVKERQLLLAVRGIVERVDIQRQRTGRLVERLDELLQEPLLQPQQLTGRDGILHPRERRLAGQVVVVGQASGHQFEEAVAAERVVVVLIFVTGDDAEHALANHLHERMETAATLVAQLRGKPG